MPDISLGTFPLTENQQGRMYMAKDAVAGNILRGFTHIEGETWVVSTRDLTDPEKASIVASLQAVPDTIKEDRVPATGADIDARYATKTTPDEKADFLLVLIKAQADGVITKEVVSTA